MRISVLGAGSWGIALSNLLANNNHIVTLWSRSDIEALQLDKEREHKIKLEGIRISDNIEITSNIMRAIADKEILIFAVPSRSIRELCNLVKPHIKDNQLIINVAKGIEDITFKTLYEVIKEVLPNNEVGILSGPSHAEEVAKGIPTSILAASYSDDVISVMQDVFMNSTLRVYGNRDVLGVEIGGAVKNIIALAAGILDGMGMGDNTKAALMTRGLAEIKRLGVAMGANQETFYGLSGIGDLIVTCTSMNSRNRRAGILIGRGYSTEDAIKEVKMVVEGYYAAKSVMGLSIKHNIEMPITKTAYNVLYLKENPKDSLINLMNRERKYED